MKVTATQLLLESGNIPQPHPVCSSAHPYDPNPRERNLDVLYRVAHVRVLARTISEVSTQFNVLS